MDRDFLSGISWGARPAANYLDVEVLGVQARYSEGHLLKEDFKSGGGTDRNDPLMVPL